MNLLAIVTFDELINFRKNVAMVDGGFDPLHDGHIAYFQEAKKLGVPVLCSVTSDAYVRTKHPVLLPIECRTHVINALKTIDYVFANDFDTETVLRQLQPRFYVKGSDWKGRLPIEQVKICNEHDIEIVYLNTVLNSSTKLLRHLMENKHITDQLNMFESFVFEQGVVPSNSYDKQYFQNDWRNEGNNYTLEIRREREGRNPQLIKDVFKPNKVLDMGCGPGFLMKFMQELGLVVDGVDFSEDVKGIAPESVRDRIKVGSVTDIGLPSKFYDLVICREVFEHMTVLQVQKAVENICRISSKYVYVTTRFHPQPNTLFDVTTEFDVDPTHITCMNKDMLRLMFVLQGFKRRPDLEKEMDWLDKRRVLVYERQV